MKAIYERRSIRRYTSQPLSEEEITELLKAAMAAPSANNKQPWEFIVIDDKSVLCQIPKFHPYAQMLNEAPIAIVVCGNNMREEREGYWVQDCSAATENILIKAQDMGLGAVWLGVYPRDERIKALKILLGIPEYVTPLSIIAVGHPAEGKEPAERFDPLKIHRNKW